VNPSKGSIESVRVEARIEDDLVLPGRVWASDRPRALIGFAHGLGEHSGRYAGLAGDLVRAGYSVAALDWPGHGEAPGRRGDMRSWTWLRDRVVPALFTATRGMPHQPDALPHVLFGHSMGGLLALDYALAHPETLIGVAVSAPALHSETPPLWKRALAQVARVAAPSIGFDAGIPSHGLSRDPEVVRARDEDALVHDVISPRLYYGLSASRIRVLGDASRLAIPALVMQGSGDLIIDPAGTEAFCAAAPERLVTRLFYQGAYHEIFNDLGRDACLRDLLAWLSRLAD
jgi:alpha-beta hydrolase superfamily lysophospholipase